MQRAADGEKIVITVRGRPMARLIGVVPEEAQDVGQESRQLLDEALAATPPVMLRSLDSLHLGALRAAKIQNIVCAELKMQHAARSAGIGVHEL